MLIIVILALLSLSCFVLVIINKHNKKVDYDVPLIPGLMSSIILSFVVIFSIMANADKNAQDVRNSTQAKIVSLNRKYNKLIKTNATGEEVRIYNEEAQQFKSDLVRKQENLNNPWTNCFTCYVYKEFNVEEIKTIDYTISEYI